MKTGNEILQTVYMYTPWALLASMIEPYHTQVLFSYVTNTVVAAFVIIRTSKKKTTSEI